MLFEKEREELAYFMRRLYMQRLTTTSGGNISLKTPDGHVLITPSQTDKGRLSADQVAVIGPDGKNLTEKLKLSMESGMHLSIYKKRQDVKAVVHAHPVFGTAFAVMHKEVNCRLMGEARAVIGEPAFADYALMGTKELAQIVAKAFTNANVVLMKNHGVIAAGNSLLQAFDRIEVLEAAARITYITACMDECNEISREDLNAIDDLFTP